MVVVASRFILVRTVDTLVARAEKIMMEVEVMQLAVMGMMGNAS